jgi:hypothetical protein
MNPLVSPKSLVWRLTRGELQGYLALAFTVMLVAIPCLRLPSARAETVLGLAILILALILGIRGGRFESGGRRAARFAMAALFCGMIASTALVCIKFLRTLDVSHP